MLPGLLPLPRLTDDPGQWPALILYASTIFLEAEGEPQLGQIAVAFVIRNRMDEQKTTARFVILGKDGLVDGDGKSFEAFSCWNDDYAGARARRLMAPSPANWESCWRAASIAYWRLDDDPTHGSTFYLNPELTIRDRADHKLPSWYDPRRVKLRVGRHEFLIA
ncbi:MAG TPA: cell wall hydrolase [Methylomirabilota bacterium]|nr:cell wall hydrolase [Methylomirabilota bacterium]